MAGQRSLSIIIAAHDEAPRIGAVLEPLAGRAAGHRPGQDARRIERPVPAQIVVVDDASTDGTARVAGRCPGVEVVRLRRQCGKGGALAAGLYRASGDIVVFLDADLVGFTADHLRRLVEPLEADPGLAMTVGRFRQGRLATDLAQAMVPVLNGQRGLARRFVEGLPDLTPLGYGVEAFLDAHAGRAGERVLTVDLPGLTQVLREEKSTRPVAAWLSRWRMYADAVAGWLEGMRGRRRRRRVGDEPGG